MLRPLQAEDLDPCADLFVSTFAQPPWSESWDISVVKRRLQQIIDTPYSYGVVLEDESIVAFAMGFSEPWHEGSHYYLKEMCVAHDRQREGIGTALLEYLSQSVRDLGASRIYLLTAVGDMSESFYKKNGFYTSPKMIMMARRFEGSAHQSTTAS